MKNILKLIFVVPLLFLIQVFFIILGLLVVPVALLLNRIEPFDPANSTSRPNHKFKDKWINAIWGNDDDGIDGDTYYLKDHVDFKRNLWTRFNWVCLRNPVHNLGLNIMGFNDNCKSLTGFTVLTHQKKKYIWACKVLCEYKNLLKATIDDQGYEYIVANDKHPMFRARWKYPIGDRGLKINIGWKNWNCDKYGEHHKYVMTVVVDLFKKFK